MIKRLDFRVYSGRHNLLTRYRRADIAGKMLDNALVILRVLLGLTLVFAHGLPKVMAPDRWDATGRAMATLGITFAPTFWGFIAGATELACV